MLSFLHSLPIGRQRTEGPHHHMVLPIASQSFHNFYKHELLKREKFNNLLSYLSLLSPTFPCFKPHRRFIIHH